MKLIDALKILQAPRPDGAKVFPVYLGCGFTPLDLKTFLQAHLQVRLEGRAVEVATGLYGDLAGELERLEPERYAAVAVAVEWSDIDPRLGLRSAGGWRVAALEDIARSAEAHLGRLCQALRRISAGAPLALSLPTLPLPPVSFTPRAQTDGLQARLRVAVEQLGLSAVRLPGCRVVSREALDMVSPLASRSDPRADIGVGFPYTGAHADTVAALLASLLAPAVARKGLITDLDDTLWSGIVGETGIEGVAWTLERHGQLHGLYQQLLQSLADAGVLLGVVSKNDPGLAAQALTHPDLFCGGGAFMPVEATWGPKSEAVARVLKKWNVAPDAVVFVDDSPMEVAEVQAAFPAMDCRLFPKNDAAAAVRLMADLRDSFGRPALSEEDQIRSASIQQGEIAAAGTTDFVRELQGVVSFSYASAPDDMRPFELINKTNQFNLNGRRWQEAEWRRWTANPDAVVMVAGYRDRFGPLGRISVLLGRREPGHVEVAQWVLSCRAFSRHIEYACLEQLFERTGAQQLRFAYAATERNGPLREFLTSLLGAEPADGAVLTRTRFREICPELFHQVEAVS